MKFDKGIIDHMLGRRITGIAFKRRKPGSKNVVNNLLYFMFEDGTGFELFCTGDILPKQVEQCMVPGRLLSLGKERYDDEFVAVSNESDEGYKTLINKPAVLE